jgi:hypothetical protein
VLQPGRCFDWLKNNRRSEKNFCLLEFAYVVAMRPHNVLETILKAKLGYRIIQKFSCFLL